VRVERRRCHAKFRDLVEERRREGVFRADLVTDLVVDFFFGSAHQLGTWYRESGPLTADEVGTQTGRCTPYSGRKQAEAGGSRRKPAAA
jgi:hypothetical protein